MYQKDNLSIHQIAKELGVAKSTIGRWLNRFNIPSRSISDGIHLRTGNHCSLSREAKYWIDGELLGDGCLKAKNNYSAYFSYGSKHHEYIQYISKQLTAFGMKQVGKTHKRFHKDFGNISYDYVSKSYAELLPIREKWYPENKKIIPKDIKLTPLTCRQWYIGDGHLVHYGVNNKVYMTLHTNGFTVNDIDLLINKLKDLGFKSTRPKSTNIISISVKSAMDFLRYIGGSPVTCYQYKFGVYGPDALQPIL